jgi:hypothetical protein
VVDNGCLDGFQTGIHEGWSPDNLYSYIFDFGPFEEDANRGFAYEGVAGNGINNVTARGMRTKNPLDDGIVRFFEGAAGFIFVIQGDNVCCPARCKVQGQRSSFDARVPLSP